MNRHEISIDPWGRISLDWRVHKEHRFYVAAESDDGVITLLPAELVPAVRVQNRPVTPSDDTELLPSWTDSLPYGRSKE